MKTETPLVDKDYLLDKCPEMSNWTFIEFPEIPQPPNTSFGMLKVKGSIDNYPFSKFSLMPSGKGTLFMPVKAEIRRKIRKEAGDTVHVVLYRDDESLTIPKEFLLCLETEDGALEKFGTYSDGQKRAFVKWIYSAKTEQTRIDRIAKAIIMVQNGEKMY